MTAFAHNSFSNCQVTQLKDPCHVLHCIRRLDGLRIMMEFPKPKDDEEQVAENITERKQVSRLLTC